MTARRWVLRVELTPEVYEALAEEAERRLTTGPLLLAMQAEGLAENLHEHSERILIAERQRICRAIDDDADFIGYSCRHAAEHGGGGIGVAISAGERAKAIVNREPLHD